MTRGFYFECSGPIQARKRQPKPRGVILRLGGAKAARARRSPSVATGYITPLISTLPGPGFFMACTLYIQPRVKTARKLCHLLASCKKEHLGGFCLLFPRGLASASRSSGGRVYMVATHGSDPRPWLSFDQYLVVVAHCGGQTACTSTRPPNCTVNITPFLSKDTKRREWLLDTTAWRTRTSVMSCI